MAQNINSAEHADVVNHLYATDGTWSHRRLSAFQQQGKSALTLGARRKLAQTFLNGETHIEALRSKLSRDALYKKSFIDAENGLGVKPYSKLTESCYIEYIPDENFAEFAART